VLHLPWRRALRVEHIQQIATAVVSVVVILGVLGVGVERLVKMIRARNGRSDPSRNRRSTDELFEAVQAALGSSQAWREGITKMLETIAQETTGQSKDLLRHRLDLVREMGEIRAILRTQDTALALVLQRTLGVETVAKQVGELYDERGRHG